jgi:hypothetical protein
MRECCSDFVRTNNTQKGLALVKAFNAQSHLNRDGWKQWPPSTRAGERGARLACNSALGMPVTAPKPRQAFPVQHSDEDVNDEFHDGLFGFIFDAVHDLTDEEYAADRANISFASSGWAAGEHGGFPLRTIVGDTPQFKLRERTEGKRVCSSLPSGSPESPRTWFSVGLPEHVPCFQPTHYRLRHGRGSAFCALRSWDLLGSRDGGRWFLLKSHRDEALLQAPFGPGAGCVLLPPAL